MANRIKIKKGLQIPLIGESEETLRGTVTSEFVKICPEDFQGVTPKLAVRVNDAVKAGSALFYEKNHPEMLLLHLQAVLLQRLSAVKNAVFLT